MKVNVTKKSIKENYDTILKIGYCELQNLLIRKEPFAYSAGVYGWSCDYYDIGGVCVCTGYNPIGQKVDYDLVREYERKAEEFCKNCEFGEIDIKLDELIKEFIDKATNEK